MRHHDSTTFLSRPPVLGRKLMLLLLLSLTLSALAAAEAGLPPEALKERARLESLFEVIAQRYPCEIKQQGDQAKMIWFEFASKIGDVKGEVRIPIPPEVMRVWKLFNDFRIYGSGLGAPGTEVEFDGPAGRNHFGFWTDKDLMLAGHSNRMAVDDSRYDGYAILFKGRGRIDRLVLRSSYGVSQKFDDAPWSTLGKDKPIEPIGIVMDATRFRAIDGHCELERDRLWRIASHYGTHPDGLKGSKFAVSRGFYPGRGIFKLDGLEAHGYDGRKLTKDARNPGLPDYGIFAGQKLDKDRAKAIDELFGSGFEFCNCFDNWPSFMRLKNTRTPNNRGTPADFSAAAELASRYIAAEKTTLGKTAKWWEVKNESTIADEWVLHSEPNVDSWGELAKFHNVMADTIHRDHADVLVGGPTSAWMALHFGGFDLARKQLRFMDETKGHLDFYSHHFYEGSDLILRDGPAHSQGYLTGRLEGCLDLLRNHMQTTDNVKPMIISEYGSLYGGGTDLHQWVNIKNYNGYLVRFMNQVDKIDLVNAFVLPVIYWDKKADQGLFRYDEQGRLALNNKLYYYLDFWQDYHGRRIPALCMNWDSAVHLHAVMNDKTITVAVNNLNPHRVAASLDVRTGDARIQKVEQKRLYFDQGRIVSETVPLASLREIPVAVEETTLVTITLDRAIVPTEVLNERTFYGDKYLQPTAGPVDFDVACPMEDLRYSLLRICASRDGGFDKPMTVTVNGKESKPIVLTPESKENNYWGWVALKLPSDAIRANNTITVNLPQAGGYVTSVALVNAYAEPVPTNE